MPSQLHQHTPHLTPRNCTALPAEDPGTDVYLPPILPPTQNPTLPSSQAWLANSGGCHKSRHLFLEGSAVGPERGQGGIHSWKGVQWGQNEDREALTWKEAEDSDACKGGYRGLRVLVHATEAKEARADPGVHRQGRGVGDDPVLLLCLTRLHFAPRVQQAPVDAQDLRRTTGEPQDKEQGKAQAQRGRGTSEWGMKKKRQAAQKELGGRGGGGREDGNASYSCRWSRYPSRQ